MAGQKKSWGFPRWGEYGQDRDAIPVRLCDFHGCTDKADFPAPKSPHSDAKWWFCQSHAGEYNRSWNFFEGMSASEAKKTEDAERRTGKGFAQADTYGWAGAEGGDGLTGLEREALEVLQLDQEASAGEIKAKYRALAKKYHPDHNQNDKDAETMFQRVRAAYEALQLRVDVRSFRID